MSKARYADVAPAVPLNAASRQTYTYRLAGAGQRQQARDFSRVTIPFGPRLVPGIIVKRHAGKTLPGLKDIAAVSPITLEPRQISLARWLARVNQGGLGYTLRLFLPKAKRAAGNRAAVALPSPAEALAKAGPPTQQALIIGRAGKRQQAIAAAAKRIAREGGQVLVLVPEQHLALPLLEKITQIVGAPAALLHSSLAPARQGDIWRQVSSGRLQIIVGTQMALYLPWQNLRLLVLEEEHYPTHKLWDQYPRVDNRYAAAFLARLHNADFLYAASFPSLRLRQLLAAEAVQLGVKPEPLALRPAYLPLSEEDRLKRYAIPTELIRKLKQWRRQNKSVLLYHNRLNTRRIAAVLKAVGISLAENKSWLTLSTSAVFAGRPGEIFHHVVWLFPDNDLAIPDFRAEEQLLITLARLHQITSGRQVYVVPRRGQSVPALDNPDQAMEKILAERRQFHYPPFSDLVRLTVTAKTRPASWSKAVKIRQQIDQRLTRQKKSVQADIRIRGPYNQPQAKSAAANDTFILLSGPLDSLVPLYDQLALSSADLSPAQIT